MFFNEEFIRVSTQDRIVRLHQEAAKRSHSAPRPRQDAANLLRRIAERLEPNAPKGGSYVSQHG